MPAAGGRFDRNALHNVPKAARGPYIWLAAIWASYCGGLHGFNTANISGAMSLDPFARDFGWTHLTDAQVSNNSGWAVSSMLLVSGTHPSRTKSPLTPFLARVKPQASSYLARWASVEAGSLSSS
jgi:hypothetical protein